MSSTDPPVTGRIMASVGEGVGVGSDGTGGAVGMTSGMGVGVSTGIGGVGVAPGANVGVGVGVPAGTGEVGVAPGANVGVGVSGSGVGVNPASAVALTSVIIRPTIR